MAPRNDEYEREKWERAKWEITNDTLEKLRARIEGHDVELAVIKTKMAMLGGLGGLVGSIVGAVVVFYLKK